MTAVADVIDHLAGIETGSRLDEVRRLRPQARENAQQSYLALFAPTEPEGLSRQERLVIATFVAGLHRRPSIHAFYQGELAAFPGEELAGHLEAEIAAGMTEGPYGAYPSGPLSREDRPGPRYRVTPAGRNTLGARLSAALEHAHLLVFHPRDAAPADLQALLDSGLSTTEVVTLSQLVAFLTFQIRVIAGLETQAATGGGR